MKNLASLLLVLTITLLSFAQKGSAQGVFIPTCKVQQVYPKISITEAELADAKTLIDLNRHYKPSWVKEYRSVEISAVQNGKTMKIKSPDNNITTDQKALMQGADIGSEISVIVHYLPDNNLQHNEARFEDFTITIDPNVSAGFPKGDAALNQYFTESVLEQTDHSVYKQYNLSSVKFTITEEGQIINAHIIHSTDDEATDKILLESVCSMPNWTPAQYTDGTKTRQDFVLTVGDMSSCTMNVLNVRNLAVESH